MQPGRDLSRKAFFAAVLFESSLVGVALVLGSLTDVSPLGSIRLEWDSALLGVALTLPPLAFLAWFLRTEWAPLRGIRRTLDESFVPIFRGCSWDEILALALVAGVAEEILFRGWLQTWLEVQADPWSALLLSAILFGIVHALTRAYAVLAAGIGLYLGFAYLATGNLLTPIVIHALYDAVALWLLLRRPTTPSNDLPPGAPPDVFEEDGSAPPG